MHLKIGANKALVEEKDYLWLGENGKTSEVEKWVKRLLTVRFQLWMK